MLLANNVGGINTFMAQAYAHESMSISSITKKYWYSVSSSCMNQVQMDDDILQGQVVKCQIIGVVLPL
jgi:hypothetical protein